MIIALHMLTADDYGGERAHESSVLMIMANFTTLAKISLMLRWLSLANSYLLTIIIIVTIILL